MASSRQKAMLQPRGHFGLVAAEDRRCPGDADGVQPVGDILFPCVDVDRAVRQQSCRISGTQQHAAAADEASRTCDGAMVAHEIRMEDDIAVDLDDVGARGARSPCCGCCRRGIRCPPAIRGRSGWTSARGNVRSAVRCARPEPSSATSISAGATVCRKLLFRQSSNASGQL